MHRGYIKLWRKMREWEWYKDSQTLHLFLHLMLNANYKTTKFMGIEILRGQIVTGRNQLSKDTGITAQSIRTCIERLKSTNEITSKSTNKFSVITLCNYEIYQNDISEISQQIPNRLTNDQPATNQQLTTSKEVNKLISKEKDIYSDFRIEIIDYFNLKAKSHFHINSMKTIEHINGRLREGFTVEDFKKVIDRKTIQWLGDSKMVKFLRPLTLFSPEHFENYLNEPELKQVLPTRILQ